MRYRPIVLGLGLAVAGLSHAHAASYADGVCASLRAERPAIKAPIAVIGHSPVLSKGEFYDHRFYFRCAPIPGGERMKPVDAETYVPAGVNPFADSLNQ